MKNKQNIIFVTVIILAVIIGYLFWPFTLTLEINDPIGTPIIAKVTIINSKGEIVFDTIETKITKSLTKDTYTIYVEAKEYETKTITIENGMFQMPKSKITKEIVLQKPTLSNMIVS